MDNFNFDPNKKYTFRFLPPVSTNDKYKFVYHYKSDNRVDIKQNNVPVELKIGIFDTFENNLN